MHYFDPDTITTESSASFADVFKNVLSGKAGFGIVPLENSLAGSIHENYDLLLQYPDIKIVGETKLRIEHHLIALPGTSMDQIKTVYSHPQGLAQCRDFLDGHPDWEQIPFYDTAGSVAMVAEKKDSSIAAIASEKAAGVYGMEILKNGIETNPRNYTRFAVITREDQPDVGSPDKASLVFSLHSHPGALYSTLKILSEGKLNMTKLESRPILGKPWEYMFYVDVDVPEEFDQFMSTVDMLREETASMRILGVYKKK